MSELYTAQHGEDRWIEQHWDELGLPEHGTFVEAGAADGVIYSNTHWLAKAKGWTGLLIEPDERTATKIGRNRPESNVEIVAVGAAAGVGKFMLNGEPTLSGFRRTHGRPTSVPIETLTGLLDRHGIEHVDVLSIDTEGTELEVWAGLDLSRWRPALVVMEWDTLGLPSQEGAILERMEADGYALAAKLGGNLLFRPAEATA